MNTLESPGGQLSQGRSWSLPSNRWAMLTIFVAALVIAWSLPLRDWIGNLQQLERGQGIWSLLGFVGGFLLLTLFSLPVWPMPFVAGAVFGPVWGCVVASASCVLAAIVSFLIARQLRRSWLREYVERSPRFRALERTVEVGDWKAVAAVRLSHLLPFGMQNYAFGLSGISLRRYALTTWLITLPGTCLQVYLGYLGFASLDSWRSDAATDWQAWAMRIGAFVVLAAAVGYLAYLGRTIYWKEAKRQLEEQLEAETPQQHQANGRNWLEWVLWGMAICLAAVAGICLAFRASSV